MHGLLPLYNLCKNSFFVEPWRIFFLILHYSAHTPKELPHTTSTMQQPKFFLLCSLVSFDFIGAGEASQLISRSTESAIPVDPKPELYKNPLLMLCFNRRALHSTPECYLLLSFLGKLFSLLWANSGIICVKEERGQVAPDPGTLLWPCNPSLNN